MLRRRARKMLRGTAAGLVVQEALRRRKIIAEIFATERPSSIFVTSHRHSSEKQIREVSLWEAKMEFE